jgi:hypothetical protein
VLLFSWVTCFLHRQRVKLSINVSFFDVLLLPLLPAASRSPSCMRAGQAPCRWCALGGGAAAADHADPGGVRGGLLILLVFDVFPMLSLLFLNVFMGRMLFADSSSCPPRSPSSSCPSSTWPPRRAAAPTPCVSWMGITALPTVRNGWGRCCWGSCGTWWRAWCSSVPAGVQRLPVPFLLSVAAERLTGTWVKGSPSRRSRPSSPSCSRPTTTWPSPRPSPTRPAASTRSTSAQPASTRIESPRVKRTSHPVQLLGDQIWRGEESCNRSSCHKHNFYQSGGRRDAVVLPHLRLFPSPSLGRAHQEHHLHVAGRSSFTARAASTRSTRSSRCVAWLQRASSGDARRGRGPVNEPRVRWWKWCCWARAWAWACACTGCCALAFNRGARVPLSSLAASTTRCASGRSRASPPPSTT